MQGKTVVVVTHDVEFVSECNPRVILMSGGEILADGFGKNVLTNIEVLTQASIVPPQVTEIFMGIKDLGFPVDIIDLYEAKELLMKRLGRK